MEVTAKIMYILLHTYINIQVLSLEALEHCTCRVGLSVDAGLSGVW